MSTPHQTPSRNTNILPITHPSGIILTRMQYCRYEVADMTDVSISTLTKWIDQLNLDIAKGERLRRTDVIKILDRFC